MCRCSVCIYTPEPSLRFYPGCSFLFFLQVEIEMKEDWRREMEFIEKVIERLGHDPEKYLVCDCKGSVPHCCVLKVPIEWRGRVPPGVYGGFTDRRGDRLAIAGVKRVGRNKVIVTVQVRTWKSFSGWQVL